MIRRAALWIGAIVALAVLAIVIHDLLKNPEPPTWEPVAGRTALSDVPQPEVRDCSGRPQRWMIFGWDGASWDLLLPLIEQGRLPNLSRLISDGATGNLAGFVPSLSPALWTTVATGLSPDEHGVPGFVKREHRLKRRLERVTRLGRVRTELYSNVDRRVPALWNLASDAGLDVMVVGYHNTYPAERVNGVMVSNYLVQARMKALMGANQELPPEIATSLAWPAELTQRVIGLEHRVERSLESEIGRFATFDSAGLQEFMERSASQEPPGDMRMYFLRRAWISDTFHNLTALELFREYRPDLLMVHSQGIDLASHHFLYFHRPELYRDRPWSRETFEELDALRGRYARVVPAFYEQMDQWLGRFLELREPETAVMVLSDHGFDAGADPANVGEHNGAPPGILVVQGPGFAPGGRALDGTLYDVLPTLLTSLDLPVAEELPGQPLRAVFCESAWQELRHERVESFAASDRFVPQIAPPPELVDEIEQELRSLGYIQ